MSSSGPATGNNYFSPALFFVMLRETLEVAIVISVLIAFVDRLSTSKYDALLSSRLSALGKMKRMIWLGTGAAFTIVLIAGGTIIGLWYAYGNNVFESSEVLYEAIFGLISCVFITITAIAFLKGQDLYDRLDKKLSKKFNAHTAELMRPAQYTDSTLTIMSHGKSGKESSQKDLSVEPLPESASADSLSVSNVFVLSPETPADSKDVSGAGLTEQEARSVDEELTRETAPSKMLFFWIPFVTVLREGLEAVLLIGGVSFGEPPSSIPLAAVTGVLVGCLIGYLIHRGAGRLSLRWFFVIGAYILFLMGSGIFSRSVGQFEDNAWGITIGSQASDDEASPAFDPRTNVWYLPSYTEQQYAGFKIMNGLLGYRAIASIGTILAYISYWLFTILVLVGLKLRARSKKA
ncbi:high-affinity iron permease [Kappamyces sp. JEL0680]|nr:high-affinity iron permease [Kappamyces sp. JEL0680]